MLAEGSQKWRTKLPPLQLPSCHSRHLVKGLVGKDTARLLRVVWKARKLTQAQQRLRASRKSAGGPRVGPWGFHKEAGLP